MLIFSITSIALNMKKKFLVRLVLSVALLTGLALMSTRIYDLEKAFQDKPKDIVIANITPTSAEIYWKATHEEVPTFTYKEKSFSGLFKNGDMKIFNNNLSENNIYISQLEDLKPNTEYIYEIKTDNNTWHEETFTFKTAKISEIPQIPNAVTGKSTPQNFILLTSEDKNYMLDTEYTGTWALDLDTEYEESVYGNYMLENQFESYASKIFKTALTTVYANSGANCRSGSNVNYSGASHDHYLDLANRMVGGCPKGHYADECYGDVVCQASSKGVDPGFALTIWLNESGASNYANLDIVQDFGINGGGISGHDFTAQLERFLDLISRGEAYLKSNLKSCTYDEAKAKASAAGGGNTDARLIVWGAVFKSGDGCNTEAGLKYMTSIITEYSWVTGGQLKWPLMKSSSVSGCNFSGTNSGYNSCDTQGTSTTPGGGGTDGGDGGDKTPTSSGTIACGAFGCRSDSDCIGFEAGGIECDEKLSHNPADQQCKRYECPAGTVIGEDGCTCEKEAVEMSQTIEIVNGINFVSTKMTPLEDEEKITAHSLIKTYDNILLIGEHYGDTWEHLVVNKEGNINGEDFQILGERAYLIISSRDMTLRWTGSGSDPLDLTKQKGWTLAPVDLLGQSSTKQILTNTIDLKINQVATWNDSTSMFNNMNIDLYGDFFGSDTSLRNVSSVFVKIE
jgi:hypothetical protein